MTKMLDTSFYLVLNGAKERNYSWRKLRAVRIVQKTNSLPRLNKDEIAVRVKVEVPQALFETPELTVTIAVAGDVPRADVSAETMDNLAERVRDVIGVPVRVTCDIPGAEE